MTVQRIETEFAGRSLILETGRTARQAAGSALVRFGDDGPRRRNSIAQCLLPSVLPLTVEYREKTHAAGKIPGGFLKREGRPSDKEILASRLIDRSIRRSFPRASRTKFRSS